MVRDRSRVRPKDGNGRCVSMPTIRLWQRHILGGLFAHIPNRSAYSGKSAANVEKWLHDKIEPATMPNKRLFVSPMFSFTIDWLIY